MSLSCPDPFINFPSDLEAETGPLGRQGSQSYDLMTSHISCLPHWWCLSLIPRLPVGYINSKEKDSGVQRSSAAVRDDICMRGGTVLAQVGWNWSHVLLSFQPYEAAPDPDSTGVTGLGQAASSTLQQSHKLLETFPSLRPSAFSSGRAWDLAREAPFIEEVYAFNSLSLSKPVVQQDLRAVNNAVWLRDFHCSVAAGSGPTGLYWPLPHPVGVPPP